MFGPQGRERGGTRGGDAGLFFLSPVWYVHMYCTVLFSFNETERKGGDYY